MFKFIHTADIHLDSPLTGLDRHANAPKAELRGATGRALQRLVQLALEEKVAFVVVAGDLFDGDWKDYRTGLFFVEQMARLTSAGIRVLIVHGNHDAGDTISRSLPYPDLVKVFGTDEVETHRLEDLQVAVHGWSYPNRDMTCDVTPRFPPPIAGWYNLGLLHTCATRVNEGHDPYAPCKLESLVNRGYQYWALGHIHTRATLWEDPYVVFPGNLQGRNARETGEKGCYLVTVVDGRTALLEFRATDVVRWESCLVDAGPAESIDELLDQAGESLRALKLRADGRGLAVRVRVRVQEELGRRVLCDPRDFAFKMQAKATAVAPGSMWIEKVEIDRISDPKREGTILSAGALADLRTVLAELRTDPKLVDKLGPELEPLDRKIPPELRSRGSIRLRDPEWLRTLLDDVEAITHEKLLGGSDRE